MKYNIRYLLDEIFLKLIFVIFHIYVLKNCCFCFIAYIFLLVFIFQQYVNSWALLCDFQPQCVCHMWRYMYVSTSKPYGYIVYNLSYVFESLWDRYATSGDLDQDAHDDLDLHFSPMLKSWFSCNNAQLCFCYLA